MNGSWQFAPRRGWGNLVRYGLVVLVVGGLAAGQVTTYLSARRQEAAGQDLVEDAGVLRADLADVERRLHLLEGPEEEHRELTKQEEAEEAFIDRFFVPEEP